MSLVTAEWLALLSRATAENEPVSTIRVNVVKACSKSMMCLL